MLPERVRPNIVALNTRRADSDGSGSDVEEEVKIGPERVFLVGVSVKSRQKQYSYSIEESLEELARLATTAGLEACAD